MHKIELPAKVPQFDADLEGIRNAKDIVLKFGGFFPGLSVEDNEKLYYGNEIPENILANARPWLEMELNDDEIVLLYYDDSFTRLGVGKEAKILTNQRYFTRSMGQITIYEFSKDLNVCFKLPDQKDLSKRVFPIDDGRPPFARLNKAIRNSYEIEIYLHKDGEPSFGSEKQGDALGVAYFMHCLSTDRGLRDFFANLRGQLGDGFGDIKLKPLSEYPEQVKRAYLMLLCPVIMADGEAEPAELTTLYGRFAELSCTAETREKCTDLLGSTAIGHQALCLAFSEAIESFSKGSRDMLVFGCLTDQLRIAKGTFMKMDKEATDAIAAYMKHFNISDDQLEANEKAVEYQIKLQKGDITEAEFQKKMKGVAGTMIAAGVPVAALALAGTAGLGAVGITSGLAAIGGLVAIIPGINAMVGGVITLTLAGIAIKKGISWISGAKEREIINKREALIQKILANHQEQIALITEDMNNLGERLSSALRDTATNSLMIDKLNSQMALFKKALKTANKRKEEGELEAKELLARK